MYAYTHDTRSDFKGLGQSMISKKILVLGDYSKYSLEILTVA